MFMKKFLFFLWFLIFSLCFYGVDDPIKNTEFFQKEDDRLQSMGLKEIRERNLTRKLISSTMEHPAMFLAQEQQSIDDIMSLSLNTLINRAGSLYALLKILNDELEVCLWSVQNVISVREKIVETLNRAHFVSVTDDYQEKSVKPFYQKLSLEIASSMPNPGKDLSIDVFLNGEATQLNPLLIKAKDVVTSSLDINKDLFKDYEKGALSPEELGRFLRKHNLDSSLMDQYLHLLVENKRKLEETFENISLNQLSSYQEQLSYDNVRSNSCLMIALNPQKEFNAHTLPITPFIWGNLSQEQQLIVNKAASSDFWKGSFIFDSVTPYLALPLMCNPVRIVNRQTEENQDGIFIASSFDSQSFSYITQNSDKKVSQYIEECFRIINPFWPVSLYYSVGGTETISYDSHLVLRGAITHAWHSSHFISARVRNNNDYKDSFNWRFYNRYYSPDTGVTVTSSDNFVNNFTLLYKTEEGKFQENENNDLSFDPDSRLWRPRSKSRTRNENKMDMSQNSQQYILTKVGVSEVETHDDLNSVLEKLKSISSEEKKEYTLYGNDLDGVNGEDFYNTFSNKGS